MTTLPSRRLALATALLGVAGLFGQVPTAAAAPVPAHVRGTETAIDWLNGRAHGEYADGSTAVADWTTGKVGMIGKSWDGTVANGVAATGVDGLATIVPISTISSWYDYYRDNGALYTVDNG